MKLTITYMNKDYDKNEQYIESIRVIESNNIDFSFLREMRDEKYNEDYDSENLDDFLIIEPLNIDYIRLLLIENVGDIGEIEKFKNELRNKLMLGQNINIIAIENMEEYQIIKLI